MGSFMHKGSVSGWEPHWTADSNFILRKIGQQERELDKIAYIAGLSSICMEPVNSKYSLDYKLQKLQICYGRKFAQTRDKSNFSEPDKS